MAYNGKASKQQAKIAAYVLSYEFGATQSSIAQVFNTSQSVISQWIKEVTYQKKIGDLEGQIDKAMELVQELSKQLQIESKRLD
ncbi:helix-turn-helix domain-containing protein [Neisseria zalophi]|uniref:Helix-turn-helix domain-containing protein n=1 Tax=Neisseria zalophi TaxID=640030 RepID=A0A5J6PVF9_9NEIS|nr:helix-turn-helix domain-containing protein [Neisseria zalophi]QEY26266.1 helix-turn-helix domain-containing protein [Neisseria zalophi]